MLKPLKCPSCGATVDNFDEFTKSAICPYCGTELLDVPDLQARYEVEIHVDDVPTPASLSRRGFELIRLGEYAQADADFEQAMKIDGSRFLAYYGKALVANIGCNGAATVGFYLQRAVELYPKAPVDEIEIARDATGYACVDDANIGGCTPLMKRLPQLGVQGAGEMLSNFGASSARLGDYDKRVADAARRASRSKTLSVAIPVALVTLFFVLLFADWVDGGFKAFMVVSAFIVFSVIMAVGSTKK